MPDAPLVYFPSQQLRQDLRYGNDAAWHLATDQYNKGIYLDSLCNTISYIDAAIGEQFRNNPAAGVVVSHGSVQIIFLIADGEFRVLAPFVSITNAQKLVILRKTCEINFNELNLARIECSGDELAFLFRCPLEACEPWKIHDTLKEICWTADSYDDTFTAVYGAARVYTMPVTYYTPERKTGCWQGFKSYLQEANSWISYWNGQGFPYVAWDIVYITLVKIDHLVGAQGSIKKHIEININRLYEERDISELVNDGISCLNALDNLSEEGFYTQLYDVTTFIPAKIIGAAANIQNSLKAYLTEASTYMEKKQFISAYLCLQKGIFRMLYNYRMNETQWNHLESILAVKHPSVTDAANTLYNQLYEFYNNPRDVIAAPAPKQEAPKKELSTWFN